MKDCLQKVIREVKVGDSPDFQRTLLQAALLMEKFHDSGSWQGIETNVEDAEVTAESIDELREVLVEFSQTHREHPDVGTAIWALGRCWGNDLREFFIYEMKAHLTAKRFFPLSQAEGALFHFGGGVDYDFAPGETAPEGYFEACRKFLENQSK